MNVPRQQGSGSSVGYKDALFGVVTLLLGLLVAVMGVFALMMWLDARNNNNSSKTATVSGMDMSSNADLGALTSYAGAAPANADALATAHKPYPGRAAAGLCRRRSPTSISSSPT